MVLLSGKRDYKKIPKELQELGGFCLFNDNKAPIAIHEGQKINPADAKTGGSFTEALEAYQKGKGSGIGLIMGTMENGTPKAGQAICIDFDHILDRKKIINDSEAYELVCKLKDMGAYIEISPSGTGLHAFIMADNLPPVNKMKSIIYKGKDSHADIFTAKHYSTLTGEIWSDCEDLGKTSARNIISTLKNAGARLGGEDTKEQPKQELKQDEGQIADIISGALADEAIRGLWEGNADYLPPFKDAEKERSRDKSPSAVIMALCNRMVEYTGANPGLLEAVVDHSPIARLSHSWQNTAKTGGRYQTIKKAIEKYEAYRAKKAEQEQSARKEEITTTGELFNAEALYNPASEYVVIARNEIEAKAVLEAGGNALGLNGMSNIKLLVEQIEKEAPAGVVVLSLNSDQDGQRIEKILKRKLKRLNTDYEVIPLNGKYDTIEEHLELNKNLLVELVKNIPQRLEDRPDTIASYFEGDMLQDLQTFKSGIKTGYINLDNREGGLYSGLYVIGAITSLGKTTFIHQMADQLAKGGNDVIFFSLEQSKLELITKSISRELAIKYLDTNKNLCRTSIYLRKNGITGESRETAKEYLKSVGNRFSAIEGNFNCTVNYIADYTRRYIDKTGVTPIVIVDYLQAIRPLRPDKNMSDKDITDENIIALKQLSSELNACIIVISSLNRMNYNTPVDLEAFKESGGIEYTVDVLWGLQLKVLSENNVFKTDAKKAAKAEIIKTEKGKNPRELELVVLKNRYGEIGGRSLSFKYYPQYDYFVPDFGFWDSLEKESEATNNKDDKERPSHF